MSYRAPHFNTTELLFILRPCKIPDLYLKNQLFALKYTLKHSLFKIKLISTTTCFGPIPEDGLIGPKHVIVLINLILKSECFKVYFSAKSWFLKYKSLLNSI